MQCGYDPAVPADLYDGLIYFDQTTPSVLLRAKTEAPNPPRLHPSAPPEGSRCPPEGAAKFQRAVTALQGKRRASGGQSLPSRGLRPRSRRRTPYSLRIATIGSTRAARRAGSQVAARATRASRTAMPAKVKGSRALTP
jgi:hypothetical protein